MHKALLPLSALALILSFAPASAMCGGDQQAQSTGQGGMSCGRPSQSTQAEDRFGMKVQPQQKPQQTSTMCPCCKNMAGMMGGEMKMDDDGPHKGMDMPPKQ